MDSVVGNRQCFLRYAAMNTAGDTGRSENGYFWRTWQYRAASHGSCITYA